MCIDPLLKEFSDIWKIKELSGDFSKVKGNRGNKEATQTA